MMDSSSEVAVERLRRERDFFVLSSLSRRRFRLLCDSFPLLDFPDEVSLPFDEFLAAQSLCR